MFMPLKFFTIEEANRMIPFLRRILEEIRSKRREAYEKQLMLEESLKMVWKGEGPAIKGFFQLKEELEFILDEIQEKLNTIDKYGCIIKDAEKGLVDFPALIKGQEVYLCWRIDEERISYWHGLNEDFSGRKPLYELIKDEEFYPSA